MRLKKLLCIISFIIILSFILYFGLKKNGQASINSFDIDSDSDLIFTKNSMLYTDEGFLAKHSFDDGFIIELTVKPERLDEKRFSVLLMLTYGDSKKQFVIGQWQNSLMIMNGDDYSNNRKEPKIYVPLSEKPGSYKIKVAGGFKKTTVYVDGVLERTSDNLVLKLEPSKKNYRLIIGNHSSGTAPWHGAISNISFYKNNDIAVEEISVDTISKRSDIIIPQKNSNIYPVYLQNTGFDLFYSRNLQRDAVINFLGFIPLGFISSILSFQKIKKRKIRRFLIVLCISFGVSLFIELLQVGIPGRNSSMLDLALNSAGGCLGYPLFLIFKKIRSFF